MSAMTEGSDNDDGIEFLALDEPFKSILPEEW